MIKEKCIEIVLVILLIFLSFIIFISIKVNNPVEENKISRVSLYVYNLRINNVLSMIEQKLYDGMDFKFIFDINGDKKEVNFHNDVYEILENDVLIDIVKKDDGQDIIEDISNNIPFKVKLNVICKDDEYVALGPIIEGYKPEEVYKIRVSKDGDYLKITEKSDFISLEFK